MLEVGLDKWLCSFVWIGTATRVVCEETHACNITCFPWNWDEVVQLDLVKWNQKVFWVV